MDQSKKTMRHFYCRDVLWETFEQMANDFDCSIDYLVNEAMRYYARSKNYQSPGGPPMTGNAPQPNNNNNSSGANSYPPASKPPAPRPGASTNSPGGDGRANNPPGECPRDVLRRPRRVTPTRLRRKLRADRCPVVRRGLRCTRLPLHRLRRRCRRWLRQVAGPHCSSSTTVSVTQ